MILLNEQVITPTIFPDGTSQVWKLDPKLLTGDEFNITWYFEAEREIIDLHSLRKLLPWDSEVYLHMPYLPYGRQDKEVSNESTFNLEVIAGLINALHCVKVTTDDAHNKNRFEELFFNGENLFPFKSSKWAINEFKPDYLIFPDKGAEERYSSVDYPSITLDKVRDQLTGTITSLAPKKFLKGNRILIMDDICDGGATFIKAAQLLKEHKPNLIIGLYVTHGIFSKGRQHLLDNSIDVIYTTNSLIKNKGDFKL